MRELVTQITQRIEQLSLDITEDNAHERYQDTASDSSGDSDGEDVQSPYPSLRSLPASNKKEKQPITPSRSGRRVDFGSTPTPNRSPSKNTAALASSSRSPITHCYGEHPILAAMSSRASSGTVKTSGRVLHLSKDEQERIKAGISSSDRLYVVYKGRGGVGVFRDWYVSTLHLQQLLNISTY